MTFQEEVQNLKSKYIVAFDTLSNTHLNDDIWLLLFKWDRKIKALESIKTKEDVIKNEDVFQWLYQTLYTYETSFSQDNLFDDLVVSSTAPIVVVEYTFPQAIVALDIIQHLSQSDQNTLYYNHFQFAFISEIDKVCPDSCEKTWIKIFRLWRFLRHLEIAYRTQTEIDKDYLECMIGYWPMTNDYSFYDLSETDPPIPVIPVDEPIVVNPGPVPGTQLLFNRVFNDSGEIIAESTSDAIRILGDEYITVTINNETKTIQFSFQADLLPSSKTSIFHNDVEIGESNIFNFLDNDSIEFDFDLDAETGVLTIQAQYVGTVGEGSQTLAQTLVLGNITGGEDIIVSLGDVIHFPDAASRDLMTFEGGFSFSRILGLFSFFVDGLGVFTSGGVGIFRALNSGIVNMGSTGLAAILRLINVGGFHYQFDVTAATANRDIILRDGNLDFTGGSTGYVPVLQADGSIIMAAVSAIVDALEDITDVPAYPDDGNVYVLIEEDGVLYWEEFDLSGFITEANVINTARLYTKGQALETVVLTSTSNEVDYDLAASNAYELTLTEDTELQLPTWNAGAFPANHSQSYQIEVIQNGTGGWNLTFVAGYKFDGGTAPTLPTTAGDRFLISLSRVRNGDIYVAILNPN